MMCSPELLVVCMEGSSNHKCGENNYVDLRKRRSSHHSGLIFIFLDHSLFPLVLYDPEMPDEISFNPMSYN